MIARQLFPGNSHLMLEAYADACVKKFGYLVVDNSPSTPDPQLRLRTAIFNGETQVVYTPKVGHL
jgi:hypothetical protein